MSTSITPLGGCDSFVYETLTYLGQIGIHKEFLTQPDHICFRTTTDCGYTKFKQMLERSACELLDESIVNGRLISIFRLDKPIVSRGLEIHCLMLAAPHPSKPHPMGWERMEFVVPQGLEAFATAHPKIEFDLSGLNKPINADLSLKLPCGSVKFHSMSIVDVIKLQRVVS